MRRSENRRESSQDGRWLGHSHNISVHIAVKITLVLKRMWRPMDFCSINVIPATKPLEKRFSYFGLHYNYQR